MKLNKTDFLELSQYLIVSELGIFRYYKDSIKDIVKTYSKIYNKFELEEFLFNLWNYSKITIDSDMKNIKFNDFKEMLV